MVKTTVGNILAHVKESTEKTRFDFYVLNHSHKSEMKFDPELGEKRNRYKTMERKQCTYEIKHTRLSW